MSRPKSLTELALYKQREAYQDRASSGLPLLSAKLEREAAELLAPKQPPDVGPGGEVISKQTGQLPASQLEIRNTLATGADQIAEDASIRRTDLLMQSSF